MSGDSFTDVVAALLQLEGLPPALAASLAAGVADPHTALSAAFNAGRQYERRYKELSQERVNETPELVPAYDHCLGCKLWRDEERRRKKP